MTHPQEVEATQEQVLRANEAGHEIEKTTGNRGDGFAITVSGYPGAGKTTAAEAMRDALEKDTGLRFPVFSIMEVADEIYHEDELDELFVEEPQILAREVAEKSALSQRDNAILDGVGSLEELEFYAQYFDELGIAFIESPDVVRHSRLIEQAKENDEPMDDVSRDALRERDERASERGLNDIPDTRFHDMKIENEDITEAQLEKYAKYTARELWR